MAVAKMMVVKATPLSGYRVRLLFSDGAQKTIDMTPLLDRGPVFAALRDESVFNAVAIDDITGAPFWPSGADLNPERLRFEWPEAK